MSIILLQDTGTTLKHHGQYNLLAMAFILAPLFFILGLVWALIHFCGLRRTFSVLFILLLCTLFSFLWAVNEKKANWPKGLAGEQLIYEWGNCSIPKHFIPWGSIIPMQLSVFLRGRLVCEPQLELFSWIDTNNVLTVHCPSTALVIEGADFLKERENRKELNEEDQLSLYNRTRSLFEIRYNYSHPTKLQREYVQVFCDGKENFHIRNIVNLSKFFSDQKHVLNNTFETSQKKSLVPLNVFLILIDALSRAHSLRKLPKTMRLLESLHQSGEYSLFQYFRYHTLGTHSRPNVLALYAGAVDEEYNHEPVFFEYFNRRKYVHLWLHGSCQDFFQDYLGDRLPSCLDYEVILPFCHPSYHPLGKHPTGNFQGPYSIVARCIAGRMVHTYMIDYLKSFFYNHRHLHIGKIVVSVWLEAHEGTGEVVGTLDGDLAHFLGSDFYEYLNNTLLILLGDHGNHMSPFYLWTRDGTIEHRLPALYLLFPRWFISRYPTIEENLRVNQQHLIVAHDIFSTLTALSQFPEFGHPTHTTDDIDKMIKVQSPHQLQDVFANNNRSFDSYPPWGLLGPLPNRTCAQVGIPTWHCICE
jgi:hypothetical protein